MKLTITHLKAAWPAGAVVGDVIELASVPAWAVGKCAPAGDDAAVTTAFKQIEVVADEEQAAKPVKGRATK